MCLSETFCTATDYENILCDEHTLPGFTLIHKPRNMYRKPSGGICIAINNDIKKYVHHIENDCEQLLWCKIDKYITGTEEDVFLACVYIAPESSDYVKVSCFESIEYEILERSKHSKYVILAGDFNAHTSTQTDIIKHNITNFETELLDMSVIEPIEMKLDAMQLPINRLSDDKHKNNKWGNKLLDCCKNTGMCIVNGRYGDNSSHCTTTNDTVIDYVICTPDTLQYVSNMLVHDFNPCLSDVHVTIEMSLQCNNSIMTNPHVNTPINSTVPKSHDVDNQNVKVGPWDQDKNKDYIDNFDTVLLQELENNVDMFNVHINQQKQLDTIMNQVGNILHKAGVKTFGEKKTNTRKRNRWGDKHVSHKPHYNKGCRNKKVIFNQARKALQSAKGNKTLIKEKQIAGKNYKKEVRTAYTEYTNNVRSDVRKLHKNGNIQQYWDYIKKSKKGRNTKCDIDFKTFVDFFKTINTEHIEGNIDQENHNENETNTELDKPITADEILEAAKKLKLRKAVGGDDISNEQIKASVDVLKNTLCKIFNIVFTTGVIPTMWTEGIIKPIYKKKGSKGDPDNYRPITIISCMGKLFTSVLNIRLTKYMEKRETTENEESIGEEQLGFRKNHSTIDGVFILNALLEILTQQKKTLYCAFIDLKKCFGSIWRKGLFVKLQDYKLGSKMMNILKSLYANVKSCVQMNYVDNDGNMSYNISEMFPCINGLREGDILSPILFSLYVNDLKSFLQHNACEGINVQYENANDVTCFLQILLLMYADDTVLFATTKPRLQHSLNMYAKYCKYWKLNINASKTKVVIFGRKRKHTFTLDNHQIEVVNTFKYLGVIFNKNGRFTDAIKDNINKARLAMYSLRRTFKEKHIPIDCQIDIFEKTIEPILLYGAEIWGFENTTLIEQYYLKTIKQILGLRKSTPNYMIYGEIGKYPITAKIKMRMIKYTIRLTKGEGKKWSEILFKAMINDTNTNSYRWLNCIKNILRETGFPMLTHQMYNIQRHAKTIQQTLIDQTLQELNTDSSKCTYYKYIKDKPGMAYYLTCLSHKHTLSLMKFRTANHRLPIEIGRYTNTIRAARICPFCSSVGDEYHYVMYCPKFNTARQRYIHTQYINRPNMYKYHALMNTDDINQLQKLAVFTSIITNVFK